MMGLMEMATGAGLYLVGVFGVFGFFGIYVFGHVAAARTGKRDPNLGMKVLLTFLLTVAFQAAFNGLVAILVGAIMGANVKAALAIMLAGVVAMIAPGLLYMGPRKTGSYPVGRKALGLNAAISGLLATVAIFAIFQMLFAKGVSGKAVASVAVALVLHLGAFLGMGIAVVKSKPEESGPLPSATPAPERPVGHNDQTMII